MKSEQFYANKYTQIILFINSWDSTFESLNYWPQFLKERILIKRGDGRSDNQAKQKFEMEKRSKNFKSRYFPSEIYSIWNIIQVQIQANGLNFR